MKETAAAWKSAAADTVAELRRVDLLGRATVVLIGSMAREAATEKSDIDLLVVSPESLPRFKITPRAQIFRITRAAFLDRLKCRDDFPQWAVRFGKVVSDESHWWDEVKNNSDLQVWPDWKRKKIQAEERLSFATPLRESGDYDHAAEELLLSARHLGRALLLKEHVFPLSQPELPAQLREIGQTEVAELLDSLVDDDTPEAALEEAERAMLQALAEIGA